MIKKIALISPNKEAYSETFIKQHKNNIDGEIIYYFNGSAPRENDKEGVLLSNLQNLKHKILKKVKLTTFSQTEYALIKSFKKQKIQVVIAEYGTTAVAVYNVCKYLKLPLIPIFHGYDASIKNILKQHKKGYEKLFKYAFKIVAVSSVIKQTLVELGCGQDKIDVTPCAPNDLFFKLSPKFNTQNFIGVGRFVDKKAPYYTILAFSKIVDEFPNSKLILVGDGILLPMCKNLVKVLNIEKNVDFIGKVSHKKVRSLYQDALAFVQHSIVADNGDSEGTPVAILEASAASLPVISTFHAGIPDVIKNNITGFLVNEHDVNDMANKMIILLNDISLAKRIGIEGRKNVKNNFSIENHIGKLNQIIRTIN